jgi:hypothetical protein
VRGGVLWNPEKCAENIPKITENFKSFYLRRKSDDSLSLFRSGHEIKKGRFSGL